MRRKPGQRTDLCDFEPQTFSAVRQFSDRTQAGLADDLHNNDTVQEKLIP